MANKEALVRMYNSLPEDLKETFINMCNEDDKEILTDYLDGLKNEKNTLDFNDNVEQTRRNDVVNNTIRELTHEFKPIEKNEIIQLAQVGRLCEYGLEGDVRDFATRIRIENVDTKALNRLAGSLENKIDNPVIKELKELVTGIIESFNDSNTLTEARDKINDVYSNFKEQIDKIPFENNIKNYIEAGVRPTHGDFLTDDCSNLIKDVRYSFPIFLAEAYQNMDLTEKRDNDERGGYLYPLDRCNEKSYFEYADKLYYNKESIKEAKDIFESINKEDKFENLENNEKETDEFENNCNDYDSYESYE